MSSRWFSIVAESIPTDSEHNGCPLRKHPSLQKSSIVSSKTYENWDPTLCERGKWPDPAVMSPRPPVTLPGDGAPPSPVEARHPCPHRTRGRTVRKFSRPVRVLLVLQDCPGQDFLRGGSGGGRESAGGGGETSGRVPWEKESSPRSTGDKGVVLWESK